MVTDNENKEIARLLSNNYTFCRANIPYELVILYDDYDNSYTLTNMNCCDIITDTIKKIFTNIEQVDDFIHKYIKENENESN